MWNINNLKVNLQRLPVESGMEKGKRVMCFLKIGKMQVKVKSLVLTAEYHENPYQEAEWSALEGWEVYTRRLEMNSWRWWQRPEFLLRGLEGVEAWLLFFLFIFLLGYKSIAWCHPQPEWIFFSVSQSCRHTPKWAKPICWAFLFNLTPQLTITLIDHIPLLDDTWGPNVFKSISIFNAQRPRRVHKNVKRACFAPASVPAYFNEWVSKWCQLYPNRVSGASSL